MTLALAMDLQLARIKQRLVPTYLGPVTLPKRVVPTLEYRAHGVHPNERIRLCSCGRQKGDPRAQMCFVCRCSGGVNHGFTRVG